MDKKHHQITEEQKRIMIEWMKKHEELQSGKFSNKFTYRDGQAKWMEVTNILNSIPGAKKDWKNWRKTWQDLKSRTKNKAGAIKVRARGTGGGPPCDDKLTEMEEEILDCVKPICVEGHKQASESLVEFDFTGINETATELVDESDGDYINIRPIASQFSFTDVQPSISATKESTSAMKKVPPTSKIKVASSTAANKVPHKKISVKNRTLEAVADYKCSMKAKLKAKENYYASKLALLERLAVAKEKNVAVKERIAIAIETIADSIS